MLLFIVNVGHEEVKINKGCTLTDLIPAQYDNLSDAGENHQEGIIANICAATLLKRKLKCYQLFVQVAK